MPTCCWSVSASSRACCAPRWTSCARKGLKAGLFRPITLWPFPARELRETAKHVKSVMVVELNTGMMLEDVKLTLNGTLPVEFYGRAGGNVPMAEEITAQVFARMSALV